MKLNEAQVFSPLAMAPILMSFLTACGPGKSSGQDFAQVQENHLEREWVQMACTSSQDLAAFGASRKVSLVLLEDKTLSRVETYYSASNCTDPAVTVTYNGDFTKQAENDQDGNIDFNYKRVVVKPLNASGLAALRGLNWCGHSEWYIGVDADVTTDQRTATCSHPATPLTIPNRYRVEYEYLYLGSNEITPLSKRPGTVNRADPFHCPCPH